MKQTDVRKICNAAVCLKKWIPYFHYMNKLDITFIFLWGFIFIIYLIITTVLDMADHVCSCFAHLWLLEMLDERFCEFQLYWGKCVSSYKDRVGIFRVAVCGIWSNVLNSWHIAMCCWWFWLWSGCVCTAGQNVCQHVLLGYVSVNRIWFYILPVLYVMNLTWYPYIICLI